MKVIIFLKIFINDPESKLFYSHYYALSNSAVDEFFCKCSSSLKQYNGVIQVESKATSYLFLNIKALFVLLRKNY
jgi:hypothetical protein